MNFDSEEYDSSPGCITHYFCDHKLLLGLLSMVKCNHKLILQTPEESVSGTTPNNFGYTQLLILYQGSLSFFTWRLGKSVAAIGNV